MQGMAAGKFWIVLNPAAGKGRAERRRAEIERFMRDFANGRGFADVRGFEMVLTKGPGDALEIARNLPVAEGDAVVAAGGDGTCNEVANGLLSRGAPPPPLGVLPVGRGNDFSSAVGIPQDLGEALRILVGGSPRASDVGFVRGGLFPAGRHFLNVVGIGFDTKVVFEAQKMRIRNDLSYALGALLTVARYEPSPVLRIRFDGSEMTLPVAIVSVANGRRMGVRFRMAPDALLDDGLLDICVVPHQPSRLRILRIVRLYTKGTQAGFPGVRTGRASRFRLEAIEGGMAAHCDGETLCRDGASLEISCVPGALRIIGPPVPLA